MATSADYALGPHTFPRGWFIIAEGSELTNKPIPLRFFGKDFALYRGESGRPILLDAYCPHMQTHLAGGCSTELAKTGKQIEGDSIRCPYHGWRFGPDGRCDDIPYFEGTYPRSAVVNSYPVRELMGCVMIWHDPEGADPSYEPPYLREWDDPQWVHWRLDHLGELAIHPQEILDNMADARHLGPTHGAPCEYFETEFRDHLYIQRQGGFHAGYSCMLTTSTWYTGPGILLSKQQFGDTISFEIIAHTPIEDGLVKVWHGVLSKSQNTPPNEEDIAAAKLAQAGALESFSSDFDIWRNKNPALRVLQVATDGPFATGRKWYKQFYDNVEKQDNYHRAINGTYHVKGLEKPTIAAYGLEGNLF